MCSRQTQICIRKPHILNSHREKNVFLFSWPIEHYTRQRSLKKWQKQDFIPFTFLLFGQRVVHPGGKVAEEADLSVYLCVTKDGSHSSEDCSAGRLP